MLIRRQFYLALALACVAVIFRPGVAIAAPPPVTPSVQAPDGPRITEIPLDSPEVVTLRPESVGKPTPNSFPRTVAAQLIPPRAEGAQLHLAPNPEQWANARTIVEVVEQRGLPAYAAVISLATALQESTLRNLTVAVDHDSLGVFQQRPSAGWGAPEQLTDLRYATGRFLDALLSRAPDYPSMPLWQAAQAAQRSAFPTLYARWQEQATQILRQLRPPPPPQTNANAVLSCC